MLIVTNIYLYPSGSIVITLTDHLFISRLKVSERAIIENLVIE